MATRPGMTATDRPRAAPSPSAPTAPARAAAPAWAVRTGVVAVAVLAAGTVGWYVLQLLVHLAFVTMGLAAALLLTALVTPAARRLRRAGLPASLTALGSALALLLVIAGVGGLLFVRTSEQLDDLAPALTAGIDQVRGWLVDGPLGLDGSRVDGLRDRLVTQVSQALPGPVAGARLALTVLSGLVVVLFLVFFLVKDGEDMWRWVVDRVPERRRARFDGAGRRAWSALGGYTLGVVAVAALDAVLIGAGLLVVGVPLWLSLMLLVFLGAFVPYIGALVTGAVAVLVTLVTDGAGDAVVVLVVVVVVQQLEGNLLHPLIMRRAVHLHPVVVLLAVTSGGLLFGMAGAVVAVPLVAVVHAVLEHLRETDPVAEDGPHPDGGRSDQRATPAAAAPSAR